MIIMKNGTIVITSCSILRVGRRWIIPLKHITHANHYLDCERLWDCIHYVYHSPTSIQLTHDRFHALCLISPWETANPDPNELRDHTVCLHTALDVFQTTSNSQKY